MTILAGIVTLFVTAWFVWQSWGLAIWAIVTTCQAVKVLEGVQLTQAEGNLVALTKGMTGLYTCAVLTLTFTFGYAVYMICLVRR